MSRYIDADAFIEDIKTEAMNLFMDGLKGTPRPRKELYDIIDRIESQPTADVVEVVRCKDCKYGTRLKDGGVTCRRVEGLLMIHPDDYCSYGRREECSSK